MPRAARSSEVMTTPTMGKRTPRLKPDQPEKSLPMLKDGLPMQAFAIMGSGDDPEQWQLPHHSKLIIRALTGHTGIEQSVDWLLLEKCVTLLSRYGDEGRRVTADPALIINAARHLAGHYRKCGRQIPVTLCVLI